jgi:predicted secreted protein
MTGNFIIHNEVLKVYRRPDGKGVNDLVKNVRIIIKNNLEAPMKKYSILLFLAVLLAGCATPTAAPTTNPAAGGTRPALSDPAMPIEVQAGEVFHIVVASNPSTGYHWDFIGELDGNVVELISGEYTADEPVMPGSGGVDVWTFKAVAAGQTQITLGSYPPDSSVTEPQETITFDIIVR